MNELIGILPAKEVFMTGVEWLALGKLLIELVLIPIGIAIWKTQRDKVKDGELKDFVDASVRTAEFLKEKNQLTTSKADYVSKAIAKKYPKADKEFIEILINSTLQVIDKGTSNK